MLYGILRDDTDDPAKDGYILIVPICGEKACYKDLQSEYGPMCIAHISSVVRHCIEGPSLLCSYCKRPLTPNSASEFCRTACELAGVVGANE